MTSHSGPNSALNERELTSLVLPRVRYNSNDMRFLYKMSRIKSESVKKETNSGNLGEPVDLFLSEYTKIDSGISVYTLLLGDLIQDKVSVLKQIRKLLKIKFMKFSLFQVTEKTMRPEHIVSNEINAQLWQSALLTSLGDISVKLFPHYRVVQKWINFTLVSCLLPSPDILTFP